MDRDRRADNPVPLRPVEFLILLSRAGGERHGYGITEDARRNYYRVTKAGLRVAKAEARRLVALTRTARLGGQLGDVVK